MGRKSHGSPNVSEMRAADAVFTQASIARKRTSSVSETGRIVRVPKHGTIRESIESDFWHFIIIWQCDNMIHQPKALSHM